MIDQGLLTDISYEKAKYNYIKACIKGIIKVCSKMGISTLQSYCGAQIFEALGVEQGAGRQVLHLDANTHRGHRPRGDLERSEAPPPARLPRARGEPGVLVSGGDYQWRADGERHLFNPHTIHKLQAAVRFRDGDCGQGLQDLQGISTLSTPRRRSSARCAGCSTCSWAAEPIPLEEVEPVEAIVKRFKTGAMSYGSISQGSARDAGDRHEPHRRTEQHRRRRRRSRRAMPGRNERGDSQEQRHQAGGFGPLWRHQPIPGQRPASCRSRWRRAPNPAKAASCPAPRSIPGSPRCATRRPAWG